MEPCNVPFTSANLFATFCPLQGSDSDPISFYRSDGSIDEGEGYRNPVNYATSYLDLDFVYSRSEEEAQALRTLEGGFMKVSASGIPLRNSDGTWLVGMANLSPYVYICVYILIMK